MNHIAKYACVAGGKRAASECASEGDEVSVELRHKSRAPAPKARRYAGGQGGGENIVSTLRHREETGNSNGFFITVRNALAISGNFLDHPCLQNKQEKRVELEFDVQGDEALIRFVGYSLHYMQWISLRAAPLAPTEGGRVAGGEGEAKDFFIVIKADLFKILNKLRSWFLSRLPVAWKAFGIADILKQRASYYNLELVVYDTFVKIPADQSEKSEDQSMHAYVLRQNATNKAYLCMFVAVDDWWVRARCYKFPVLWHDEEWEQWLKHPEEEICDLEARLTGLNDEEEEVICDPSFQAEDEAELSTLCEDCVQHIFRMLPMYK